MRRLPVLAVLLAACGTTLVPDDWEADVVTATCERVITCSPDDLAPLEADQATCEGCLATRAPLQCYFEYCPSFDATEAQACLDAVAEVTETCEADPAATASCFPDRIYADCNQEGLSACIRRNSEAQVGIDADCAASDISF